MNAKSAAPAGGDTERLVSRLRQARRQSETQSAEERQQTLLSALQEELAGLSEDEAGRRVEQAREHLVGEARNREAALTGLQGDVARLKSEVEVLKAAREVLAKENQQLRKSLEGGGGGSSQALDKIKEGLRKMADGDEVTPDSIGLPPSEARLFRLSQELLGFALRIEFGVQTLMSDVGAGQAGDTRYMRGLDKMTRNRFRACLDNKQGSIAALKETLDKNSRFLHNLNDAYLFSMKKAVPSLLAELDPEQIIESHRGKLMTNYEQAWKSFALLHNDHANLSSGEVWERYFQTPFRAKLAENVGQEPGKA